MPNYPTPKMLLKLLKKRLKAKFQQNDLTFKNPDSDVRVFISYSVQAKGQINTVLKTQIR